MDGWGSFAEDWPIGGWAHLQRYRCANVPDARSYCFVEKLESWVGSQKCRSNGSSIKSGIIPLVHSAQGFLLYAVGPPPIAPNINIILIYDTLSTPGYVEVYFLRAQPCGSTADGREAHCT